MSDLRRGKLDVFFVDAVVNTLTAAGLRLDVRIVAAPS
jgi:predicted XRE-type DNA-binding protein